MIEFSIKNHKFCFVWSALIMMQMLLLFLWDIGYVPSEFIFIELPVVSICLFFINMCESENLGILKIRHIQYGLVLCEKEKFKTFIKFEIILALLCIIQLCIYREVEDAIEVISLMIIFCVYVIIIYIIGEILAITTSRYITSIIALALFLVVQNENNLIKMLYWNQLKIWINVKDEVCSTKNYYDSYPIFCICAAMVIFIYFVIIYIKGKGTKIEE